MKTNTYTLGKCDYNNSGRKNCKAVIEWEIKEGRFSMSAGIWNPRETDYYTCGQAVDTVASFFPHDKKAQRMLEIWKKWHLNDMKAGSPAQEAFLATNPVSYTYPETHYEKACEALAAAGINPDPNYIHNGKPYEYGSAWLKVELPAEVIAEINSWSDAD
jgi:hypothetical protein